MRFVAVDGVDQYQVADNRYQGPDQEPIISMEWQVRETVSLLEVVTLEVLPSLSDEVLVFLAMEGVDHYHVGNHRY